MYPATSPLLTDLYQLNMLARRKRSAGKATWPGRKQVWRSFGDDGRMAGDVLSLQDDRHTGEALLDEEAARFPVIVAAGLIALAEQVDRRTAARRGLITFPPFDDLERHSTRSLPDDLDRRVLPSVALHQFEQRSCIVGAQSDAAMGNRASEVAEFSGAMDGVAAAKEDRIRHRCIIVEPGIVHPLQRIGREVADRRPIAASGRRYRPGRKIRAVDRDTHGLPRKLDSDGDARLCGIDRRTGAQDTHYKQPTKPAASLTPDIHNQAAASLSAKVCCPCAA